MRPELSAADAAAELELWARAREHSAAERLKLERLVQESELLAKGWGSGQHAAVERSNTNEVATVRPPTRRRAEQRLVSNG